MQLPSPLQCRPLLASMLSPLHHTTRHTQAATVNMRNALLGDLLKLQGAYWLPKDILMFRKAPPPGSEAAQRWSDAREDLLAHRDRIQWCVRVSAVCVYVWLHVCEVDAPTPQFAPYMFPRRFSAGGSVPTALRVHVAMDGKEYQRLLTGASSLQPPRAANATETATQYGDLDDSGLLGVWQTILRSRPHAANGTVRGEGGGLLYTQTTPRTKAMCLLAFGGQTGPFADPVAWNGWANVHCKVCPRHNRPQLNVYRHGQAAAAWCGRPLSICGPVSSVP
jgi:hypothetical protein